MHHCFHFTDYKTERPKVMQLESDKARICLYILSTIIILEKEVGEFKSANSRGHESLHTAKYSVSFHYHHIAITTSDRPVSSTQPNPTDLSQSWLAGL